MNKSEIIRKISKKAGVPDSEAKKFFEVFLKRASDELKPGESIKVNGVGLFQLRVGQIENSVSRKTGVDFIYSDLIVFVEENPTTAQGKEEVIFNVPSGLQEDYQPIDSHFSLSLGKPIIPLKGVNPSEFFIPPSGVELRSLIESKVDRLLDESVKLSGGKETESIQIAVSDSDLKESIDWEESESTKKPVEEPKIPSRSEFLKTREFENLSWDFGETLSEEEDEETIQDYEPEKINEEKKTNNKEEHLKTFEEFEEEEIIKDEPDFEEEKYDEEISDEEIFEDAFDDEPEEDVPMEMKEELEPEPEISSSEIDKDIKEAEAFVSEMSSESQITPVEKSESETPTKPEDPFLKNFQRVTSFTKEFSTNDFDGVDNDEPEIEEKPKKVTEVRSGFQKVRRTTAEFDFDLSGIKGLDEEDSIIEGKKKEKQKTVKPSLNSKGQYLGYERKSSMPAFIIALVVILALAGLFFLYMKLKSANHGMTSLSTSTDKTQKTKVIDRDYDVPVTYPYKPGEEKKDVSAQQGTDKNSEGTKTTISENSPTANNTSNNTGDEIR